jgi:glycosyltransferase involved in cell wall biosynthesis
VHRLGAEYAERLKERVAAPDLAGSVVLAGARRDVAACMDAMDVVVHASDREPFGRVLLEAMAATRPVIAPREGGPLEIVADGHTGVLVPPRDADALAAAIVSLLEDPARRAEMARAARAHVAARFDIRQHARAVEAVLDDVLRRRAAGTAA